MGRFTGVLGMLVILAGAYLFSTSRKSIQLKTVLWGLGLQLTLGYFPPAHTDSEPPGMRATEDGGVVLKLVAVLDGGRTPQRRAAAVEGSEHLQRFASSRKYRERHKRWQQRSDRDADVGDKTKQGRKGTPQRRVGQGEQPHSHSDGQSVANVSQGKQ